MKNNNVWVAVVVAIAVFVIVYVVQTRDPQLGRSPSYPYAYVACIDADGGAVTESPSGAVGIASPIHFHEINSLALFAYGVARSPYKTLSPEKSYVPQLPVFVHSLGRFGVVTLLKFSDTTNEFAAVL